MGSEYNFPIQKSITNSVALFILVTAITATLYIYWPGLNGAFILDDVSNLSPLNSDGGITNFSAFQNFVFGNNSGTFGRPVSMLAFLIDDQYYPGDVAKYRYTNLLIHILCGLLIFILLSKILSLTKLNLQKQLLIAGLTSIVWLLHPLNVSTTLYVIQRIAQMMTLFTLLGLILYVSGRTKIQSDAKKGILYMTLGMVPFGLLSILSKENGVLIALYIVILEFTVFRSLPRPKIHKLWLTIFTIVPLVLLALYFIYNFQSSIYGYNIREFNMLERLLTESRVLFLYLFYILIPQSGKTGIYQDDFLISQHLLSPPTTLLSLLSIFLLLILAFRYRKIYPIFSFATFWFFGGHILESTFLPLEIYFEHRNYLPMVGPLFGLIYFIISPYKANQSPAVTYLGRGLIIIILITAPLLTYQSAKLWGHPHLLYKVWHLEHPISLRAATIYGASLANYSGQPVDALEVLNKAYKTHPNAIALPILMLHLSCKFNLEPIFSSDEIASAAPMGTYRGILPTAIKMLLETYSNSHCSIDVDDLHKILFAMEEIKHVPSTALSAILIMHSDVYIQQRQLSPSIELLDKAYKYNPNTEIPIKQAQLLASAGLYNEALLYLDKAEFSDKNRKLLVSSLLPVINHLREIIHRTM